MDTYQKSLESINAELGASKEQIREAKEKLEEL
jgi:hypothetical protein